MAYFDNAATTQPSAAALDSFLHCATITFANPSSQHHAGKAAKAALEQARQEVAASIGANADEIVFTSGGTEADNLAIQGVCAAQPDQPKIIISAVEHPAVYKACRMLKRNGRKLAKVPVGLDGSIDEEFLAATVDASTALVSFMAVNNETGAILPIRQIVDIVHRKNPHTLIHTDAVQALGKLPLDVQDLGVDLMSLSAHKVHGLKGAGALYIKGGAKRDKNGGTPIFPVQFGGGQEAGLRSGTEAVALAAAFGRAALDSVARLGVEREHASRLKQRLLAGLEQTAGVIVNSTAGGVPEIVNFSVPKQNPDDLLAALSDAGYYISRGAACKSNHTHGPSMLMMFGLPAEIADAALRVSFASENTLTEVDGFIAALRAILT